MAEGKVTVNINLADLDEVKRVIRHLQEQIEGMYNAIVAIQPTELRLMASGVREGLRDVVEGAESTVYEVRRTRAQEAQDVASGGGAEASVMPDDPDYFAITGVTTIIGVENLKAGDKALMARSTDEAVAFLDANRLPTADTQAPGPEELGETVMCPQTKGGVPCNRTLHNVGLHTPKGYPANDSWTDKESD